MWAKPVTVRIRHGERFRLVRPLLPPLSIMNTNTSPLDADREVILQVSLVYLSSSVPPILIVHVCCGIGCS